MNTEHGRGGRDHRDNLVWEAAIVGALGAIEALAYLAQSDAERRRARHAFESVARLSGGHGQTGWIVDRLRGIADGSRPAANDAPDAPPTAG